MSYKTACLRFRRHLPGFVRSVIRCLTISALAGQQVTMAMSADRKLDTADTLIGVCFVDGAMTVKLYSATVAKLADLVHTVI